MTYVSGTTVTPEWNQAPQSEDEVLKLLKKSPALYVSFRKLNDTWRQRFLDFCQGKKSLPLLYDPFFKRIFHPDIHPDRLSRLVSSLLGINVRIIRILPNEDSMLDGESVLIMDLLGELEDGSLVNIEIQKQAYAFPAERISCYSSDLVMRQYARVRGSMGSAFTYRDIKKVYVIVIYEKSTIAFHGIMNSYIHYGKTTFDTGLAMEFLQEYCLIALDVFREFPYSKNRNEQTAWLSLLATETPEEAEALSSEYPWLAEIYQEIASLRQNPEEVLGMFSEALRMLDQNTMKYMIDEMKQEIDEQKAALAEKDTVIDEKDAVISEKDAVISEKDAVISEKDAVISEKDAVISEKDAEIAALKKLLEDTKE